MAGLGTLINVGFIVFGGVFGAIFGKALKPHVQETLMTVSGVAVIFIGAGGTFEKMLVVSDGGLAVQGIMMMIVSLVIGAVIGELLKIETGIERFGVWLKSRSGNGSDGNFVSAFVSASCIVCIGAMAVVGAIEDGINGDYSILLAKGILDAIIICVMTAAQGKGCIFAAVPVAVFQGLITVIAVYFGSFMTKAALDNLSYVGSVLIFCVGLNLVREKKIRVANILPAIVVAAAWAYLPV